MPLNALIFDVDGTLADTEKDAHRVAFNRAFADAGLAWNWTEELYGNLLAIAGGKERIRYYLDHHHFEEHHHFDRLDCHNSNPYDLEHSGFSAVSSLREEEIAALHRAKTLHYKQLLAEEGLPLRPGVRRLLQEARQSGLRLAIATTSALDNVLALLQHSLDPQSPSWFEVIAAGDIVPRKKPAPDIYHYVLEKMALPPHQCLVIEDSHQGLMAATQANLPTFITVNGYTQTQDFTGAIAIVEHLGDPDHPTRAIAGNLEGATCVTLPLLTRLHQAATWVS